VDIIAKSEGHKKCCLSLAFSAALGVNILGDT
jgi:hypothetical protein